MIVPLLPFHAFLPGQLEIFFWVMPHLTLEMRKVFLTLCRVQDHYTLNQRLKDLVLPFADTTIAYTIDRSRGSLPKTMEFITFPSLFEKFYLDISPNSILCSILSMLIRVIPLEEPAEAFEVKMKTLEKEIQCALGDDRPQVLNYDPWFKPESSHEAVHPFIGPRVKVNQTIFKRLHLAKRIISRLTLLPRASYLKSVSRASAHQYVDNIYPQATEAERLEMVKTVTPGDLLIYYHETGEVIHGGCEVRSAWKYNDLKPRIYYCQGGDALFSSLYIQEIANTLQSVFPSVNPKTRFNLVRVINNDYDHKDFSFWLHDYSSFTSNFTEAKYFLRALADFFSDVTCQALDVSMGIIEVNVGDYLRSYIDANFVHPSFSLERFDLGLENPRENRHEKAGMLGVFGNISLCTLLHSLILHQVCLDEDSLTCVGDDAAYYPLHKEIIDPDHVLLALQDFGDLKKENVHRFNVDRPSDFEHLPHWHFLKRPIYFYGALRQTGELLDFPLISEVVNFRDSSHTVSFGHFFDRVSAVCMQTGRLFMRFPSTGLDIHSFRIVLRALEFYYENLGIPKEGSLPPHRIPSLKDFHGIIPPLDERCFEISFVDVLLLYHDRPVVLPYGVEREEIPEYVDLGYLDVGDSFEGKSRPGFEFLCRAGYLYKKTKKMVFAQDDPRISDILHLFVTGRLTSIYEFHVLKSFPFWIDDLDNLNSYAAPYDS